MRSNFIELVNQFFYTISNKFMQSVNLSKVKLCKLRHRSKPIELYSDSVAFDNIKSYYYFT